MREREGGRDSEEKGERKKIKRERVRRGKKKGKTQAFPHWLFFPFPLFAKFGPSGKGNGDADDSDGIGLEILTFSKFCFLPSLGY